MAFRFRFRRLLATAAVCVVLFPGLASVPAAAQEPAETQLSAWLSAIDASPDWASRFRSLAYDPVTRTATVDGLVVSAEAGGMELAIDRLVLDGYAPDTAGGFKAQAVRIDKARIRTSGSEITMANLRFDAIEVPDLPGVRFDPAKAFSSLVSAYSSLARISLGSGRVDEISLTRTLTGVTSRISYRNIEIGAVSAGKIDSLRAGPLEVAAPVDNPLLDLTVAAAEVRGMDLNAFVYVYDPSRYANGIGDMQWRAAVADATYRDIAITVPGVTISFDAIALQGFKMRQPRESFAPLADVIASEKAVSQSAMDIATRRYLAGLLSAYGIDRFSMEGMALKAVGIDHFGFDRFSISGASSDSIAEIALDNFEAVAPGQGRVGAERTAISGLVMPPTRRIVEAFDALKRNGDPDFSSIAPTFSRLDLSGIDLQTVDFDGLALGALSLDLGDYIGPVPTRVDLVLSGLDLPANALQPDSARRMIEGLGYERLRADAGMKARWNESASTLSLEDAEFSVNDLGRLKMNATLGGVTRAALEATGNAGGKIEGATFQQGALAFEDRSGVERALESRAKILNVPVDRLRQQLSGALPLMLAVLGNADRMKAVIPVLQQFLADPGTLTIGAAPTSPVAIETIAAAARSRPQSLIETLNITATATPPSTAAETGPPN